MGFNPRLLCIVAAGLFGLACLFYILSNALPSWATSSGTGESLSFGLWQGCVTILNQKTCLAIQCSTTEGFTPCAKLYAARAFVTIACLMAAVTVVILLLNARNQDISNKTLLMGTKALAFFCLLMGIIGVAVGISAYMVGDSRVKPSLGVGAILGIIGIVVNLAGAIVTVLIR
ncbi:hypothetical protein I4U23_015683 [Adineta vaga]|nr:hypothetical protein I4U23_015683 [Adineta vaga]